MAAKEPGKPLQTTQDDAAAQEAGMKPPGLQQPCNGTHNVLTDKRPDRYQRVPRPDLSNPFGGRPPI
jgi:hypothetical protein